MSKIWAIVWKDLLSTLRDPAALGMLLLTPFLITLVMTFAFGRQGGSALRDIPLHVVNHDRGELGARLVEGLMSDELVGLLEPVLSHDEAASRADVDDDRLTAVVIVPADFSERVLAGPGKPVSIEIYANPGREVSSSVVRGVVEQFVAAVNAGAAGVQVSLEKLVASGRLAPGQAVVASADIGRRVAEQVAVAKPITLHRESRFDWLSYFAPSLAVVFLTMAMTARTRSILEEREAGTLARLLTTPTRLAQFMAGKILGALAVGLLQMVVLVLASGLLLSVQWGTALPLSLLIVVTVTAMTSLGLLIAALSRTAEQASDYGQMVLILFAALGGHLLPRTLFPEWLATLGYVTPNAWSMEAFAQLSQGGSLADIALPLAVLAGMAALSFFVAVVALGRQMR